MPRREYLANVNVNNPDSEGFNFKTLPRPKGRATHVIVTEYDLPRKEALPHDVIVDADGHAWYSDFGNQFVGELDPKTGKVQDYALETLRQDQPKGPLDLELDPEGNIWIGMSYQAGASKIDRKTKQVTTYPLPKEWQGITTQTNMVTPTHMDVDGKVWMEDTENGRVFRLDLGSGKWEDRGQATTAKGENIRGYGLPSDKDNNLYLMSFGDTRIGKLDAKTNVAQIWTTAFARSRPRRGRFDDQNRLWFAEYAANRIAMFDPTTEQIKEWKLPTAWSAPYDVVPTKGATEVWTGSMLTRPGGAAQSQDRRDRRISPAARHQHPPRLRPGGRTAAGAVGRQQPRQRHRQGRAARLSHPLSFRGARTREPGIQAVAQSDEVFLDSGFWPAAGPGMTQSIRKHPRSGDHFKGGPR